MSFHTEAFVANGSRAMNSRLRTFDETFIFDAVQGYEDAPLNPDDLLTERTKKTRERLWELWQE